MRIYGPAILFTALVSIFLWLPQAVVAQQTRCDDARTVEVTETSTVSGAFDIDKLRHRTIRSALIRSIEMVAGIEILTQSQERLEVTLNSVKQSSSESQVFRSLGTVLEWTQTLENVKLSASGDTTLEVRITAKICPAKEGIFPIWVAIENVSFSEGQAIQSLINIINTKLSEVPRLKLSPGFADDSFHDVAISVNIDITEELVDNSAKAKMIGQLTGDISIDERMLHFRLLTSTATVEAKRFFDGFRIFQTAVRKHRIIEGEDEEMVTRRLAQESLRIAVVTLRDRLRDGEMDP